MADRSIHYKKNKGLAKILPCTVLDIQITIDPPNNSWCTRRALSLLPNFIRQFIDTPYYHEKCFTSSEIGNEIYKIACERVKWDISIINFGKVSDA